MHQIYNNQNSATLNHSNQLVSPGDYFLLFDSNPNRTTLSVKAILEVTQIDTQGSSGARVIFLAPNESIEVGDSIFSIQTYRKYIDITNEAYPINGVDYYYMR